MTTHAQIARMCANRPLPAEAQRKLARRRRRGDRKARERLILHNLRLAVNLAGRHRGLLSLEDAIQEAAAALVRAADAYDPDHGAAFSTYATTCIRRALADAQARCYQSRICTDRAALLSRLSTLLTEQVVGETPAKRLAGQLGIPERTLLRLLPLANPTMSLDETCVGEDPRFAVEDEEAEASIATIQVRRQLEALIARLPQRLARMVQMRYPLDGRQPLTLEQAGKRLGVSKQRAKQLESAALESLAAAATPQRDQLRACLT